MLASLRVGDAPVGDGDAHDADDAIGSLEDPIAPW